MKHTRNLSQTPVMVEKASSTGMPVDFQFVIDVVNAVILKKTAILTAQS